MQVQESRSEQRIGFGNGSYMPVKPGQFVFVTLRRGMAPVAACVQQRSRNGIDEPHIVVYMYDPESQCRSHRSVSIMLLKAMAPYAFASSLTADTLDCSPFTVPYIPAMITHARKHGQKMRLDAQLLVNTAMAGDREILEPDEATHRQAKRAIQNMNVFVIAAIEDGCGTRN